MDSYLDIARVVLKSQRRPMGAKAILDAAYRSGVVPEHLRGKTQQKTLQARLSEDILHRRERSLFYRTEPGQFALTEFISDPQFPAKWKVPFAARRRTRELKKPDSLAVLQKFAGTLVGKTVSLEEFQARLGTTGMLTAMHPSEMHARGYCAIWTFSVVVKLDRVLAYRVGRYRDDRDVFADRRSIGFPGALSSGDVSLFSEDLLGAEDCAISVLQQDLDLSLACFDAVHGRRPRVEGVTAIEDEDEAVDIVIVVSWESPDWFEPTTRRLSLNEPHWLSNCNRSNDIDDFEPWSARVLEWLTARGDRAYSGKEEDFGPAGCFSKVRDSNR